MKNFHSIFMYSFLFFFKGALKRNWNLIQLKIMKLTASISI